MINGKHILVLVLIFLSSPFTRSGELLAHVEKTYYLKGKVGERDLAIKMLCYDEMPIRYVHYFFGDAKKDRMLIGNIKNNTWDFRADVSKEIGDAKQGSRLRISEVRDGTWNGTWSDSAGKTWEVLLQPIVPDSISSKYSNITFIKELDPYDFIRLSNINFIKTRIEKPTRDLLCDWYLEKESGITFFRLRSKNKKLNVDSINGTLETMHLSMLQKYFEFKPEKIDTKIETSLLFLTDELVSLRNISTTTFKSLKTSLVKEAFTINIKSGEPVNLEDIVWFDKAETKPPADDLYKIYKYRKTFFAPKIFGLLLRLYPDKMKTDSCGINKVDTWVLPVWNLTKKGIALDFREQNDCGIFQWAILPYKMLKPFMGHTFHLTYPYKERIAKRIILNGNIADRIFLQPL